MSNKVLPRLYNQPEAIGRMIRRRRAARERRLDKVALASEYIQYLHHEMLFESSLKEYASNLEPVFMNTAAWGKEARS